MVNEQTRNTIIHRWHLGESQRQIARRLHVSRNTVKAVLDDSARVRSGQTACDSHLTGRRRRARLLDAHTDRIEKIMHRYPYISVVDLHKQLTTEGYRGSYTTLREHVKQVRRSGDHAGQTTAAVETGAKVFWREALAANVAGHGEPIRLFALQLNYSGLVYIHASSVVNVASLIHEHILAFHQWQGIPLILEYIDDVPALGRVPPQGAGADTTFVPMFLRFANHYGFRPLRAAQNPTATHPHMEQLLARLNRELLEGQEYGNLQETLGGTVAKYPRRKLVMTQPVSLPMYGQLSKTSYVKEELMTLWSQLADQYKLPIRTGQELCGIERNPSGTFTVVTTTGSYTARFVCLALGRRGTPRKLDIPGEELGKVGYSLIDAQSYQNRKILVVGGGDSAVEAAIGLAEQPGNQVTLSYRKSAFYRIKARNETRLMAALQQNQLTCFTTVRSAK